MPDTPVSDEMARGVAQELRSWAGSSRSNLQIGSRTLRIAEDAADVIDALLAERTPAAPVADIHTHGSG